MKVNRKGHTKYEHAAYQFSDGVVLCKACFDNNLPLSKEEFLEEVGADEPCSNCGEKIASVSPEKAAEIKE